MNDPQHQPAPDRPGPSDAYAPSQAGDGGGVVSSRLESMVRAALDELARCGGVGEGQSFEPIAEEMIAVVLSRALHKFGEKPGAWMPVARQVARSIVEDAVAGPRLQRYWEQVNAAAQP